MNSLQAALKDAGLSTTAVSEEAGHIEPFVKKSARVIKRAKVHDVGVISLRLPPSTKEGSMEVPGMEIHFLQFAHTVGRGRLNFYVRDWHTLPQPYKGLRINAKAQIWHKTLENGCAYYYIDLYPVDLPATHQLVAYAAQLQAPLDRNRMLFELPPPLRGCIMVRPLPEKAAQRKLRS